LLLIGDGEDKEKLMQLSKALHMEEDVFFLDYQTNPYPYLAQAGTLVMSSRTLLRRAYTKIRDSN